MIEMQGCLLTTFCETLVLIHGIGSKFILKIFNVEADKRHFFIVLVEEG